MNPMVFVRAVLRVLSARYGKHAFKTTLHFVPLDAPTDSRPMGTPIVSRPALCGTYIEEPGQGTTQPHIIGCWHCAVAIEREPERWAPKARQQMVTEGDFSYCKTCGGVPGFPPGCKCKISPHAVSPRSRK